MVTAFVVVFVLALFLLAGLVLDGGLALSAKVRAIDEAQAAARAGAQAIDLDTFYSSGAVVLDPAAATQAAESYLAATGDPGTVTITGNEVDVSVTVTQPMQILGLAGIGHLSLTGSGSANAVTGVEGPGQ